MHGKQLALQKHQKITYDKSARDSNLEVGQRVMVHMPSEVQGKTWKFARPFHGPFRALHRRMHEPKSHSIFVSLNRVRKCYGRTPSSVVARIYSTKVFPGPASPCRLNLNLRILDQ